ncbi:MAG: hypothetical protein IH925_04015 [Proteobacteria bacterium]|nr:hypothetical protein [Pseudomonadota bacterium]
MSVPGEMWGVYAQNDPRNRELVKMPEGKRVTYEELLASADPKIKDQINEETFIRKFESIQKGLNELNTRFDQMNPDVIVMFGDDQSEQFDFNNFPPFAIFTGDEYEGYRTLARQGIVPGTSREPTPKTKESWVSVKGHPELAKELLVGLSRRDFDVSFMMDLPNKEHGMGHAFMRPLHYIRPGFDVPVVPVYIHGAYEAAPPGRRFRDSASRGLRPGRPASSVPASSSDLVGTAAGPRRR